MTYKPGVSVREEGGRYYLVGVGEIKYDQEKGWMIGNKSYSEQDINSIMKRSERRDYGVALEQLKKTPEEHREETYKKIYPGQPVPISELKDNQPQPQTQQTTQPKEPTKPVFSVPERYWGTSSAEYGQVSPTGQVEYSPKELSVMYYPMSYGLGPLTPQAVERKIKSGEIVLEDKQQQPTGVFQTFGYDTTQRQFGFFEYNPGLQDIWNPIKRYGYEPTKEAVKTLYMPIKFFGAVGKEIEKGVTPWMMGKYGEDLSELPEYQRAGVKGVRGFAIGLTQETLGEAERNLQLYALWNLGSDIVFEGATIFKTTISPAFKSFFSPIATSSTAVFVSEITPNLVKQGLKYSWKMGKGTLKAALPLWYAGQVTKEYKEASPGLERQRVIAKAIVETSIISAASIQGKKDVFDKPTKLKSELIEYTPTQTQTTRSRSSRVVRPVSKGEGIVREFGVTKETGGKESILIETFEPGYIRGSGKVSQAKFITTGKETIGFIEYADLGVTKRVRITPKTTTEVYKDIRTGKTIKEEVYPTLEKIWGKEQPEIILTAKKDLVNVPGERFTYRKGRSQISFEKETPSKKFTEKETLSFERGFKVIQKTTSEKPSRITKVGYYEYSDEGFSFIQESSKKELMEATRIEYGFEEFQPGRIKVTGGKKTTIETIVPGKVRSKVETKIKGKGIRTIEEVEDPLSKAYGGPLAVGITTQETTIKVPEAEIKSQQDLSLIPRKTFEATTGKTGLKLFYPININLETKEEEKTRSANRLKIDLKSFEEQKQENRLDIDIRETTRTSNKLFEVIDTKNVMENIVKTDQKLKMKQELKTEQKLKLDLTPTTKPQLFTQIQKPPTGPPPPIINIPRSRPEELRKPKGLFDVLVRRKGRFERIASEKPIEEAVAIAKTKVEWTAGASFKIPGADVSEIKRLIPSRKFYESKKEPGVFIQKRQFRISTPGEKKEITFKGIFSRKTKKNIWRF